MLLAPLFDALANVELVGHDLSFDIRFLAEMGFVPRKVFCAMLASQVLHAGEKKKCYTFTETLKRELNVSVSKTAPELDWAEALTETHLENAAEDVRHLPHLAETLRRQLEDAKLSETASLEMRALLGIASAAPITVDVREWERLAAQAEVERDQCVAEMNELVPLPRSRSKPWNWNSDADIKSAFASLCITIENFQAATLQRNDHPLAKRLRDYRAISNTVSTYGNNWLDKHVINGEVFPTWNQCGAETGRMSCDSPNLQGIPRGTGHRQCLIARPGRVLIKADYSQMELRIVAKIADETKMIAAFRNGYDLHALTASEILGKPIAEVTQENRQLAKAINFGLLYGMRCRSLCQYAEWKYDVKLSEQQAKQYRDAFFCSYPMLKDWHQRTHRNLVELSANDSDATHECRSLRIAEELFSQPKLISRETVIQI